MKKKRTFYVRVIKSWNIQHSVYAGLKYLCISYLVALRLQECATLERETTNKMYCTLGKLISSVLIPTSCTTNSRIIFHSLWPKHYSVSNRPRRCLGKTRDPTDFNFTISLNSLFSFTYNSANHFSLQFLTFISFSSFISLYFIT